MSDPSVEKNGVSQKAVVSYGSLLNIENVKRERGKRHRENIRATLFPF
jgi:hypothetical protein